MEKQNHEGASNHQAQISGEAPMTGEGEKTHYRQANLHGNPRSAKAQANVQAKAQEKVGSKRPKLNGKVELSFSTCSKTLTNVNISRRGLLALEMAVGLAIYLDFTVANRAAKQMVMEAYCKAGYDCETASGKDYKTVRRRIDASAGLFGKLGAETIAKWMDGKKELKLLQAVAQEISKLEFRSMDDVLDFVGRSSNRTQKQEKTKDEAASPFDIEVGDGKVVRIPKNLTEAELLELAQKIMTLAESVHEAAEYKGEERRVASTPVEKDRRQPPTLH